MRSKYFLSSIILFVKVNRFLCSQYTYHLGSSTALFLVMSGYNVLLALLILISEHINSGQIYTASCGSPKKDSIQGKMTEFLISAFFLFYHCQ